MATPHVQPIIIKRKKAGHGGHHGGAWKVAYADFVTAMMALFIVLWLLSSSADTKKAVSGYFRDPTGAGKEVGSGQAGSGEQLSMAREEMEQLKDKIEAAFRKVPEFQEAMKDKVHMIVTGEGLRIEFTETEKGLFFLSGSHDPTVGGKELLTSLAVEVSKIPNQLLIEGHTDSRPFSGGKGYSNWELSADRANAARRLMEEAGLPAHKVTQVRGFADQLLREQKDSAAPSNRRISVVIQYLKNAQVEASASVAPATENKVAEKPKATH